MSKEDVEELERAQFHVPQVGDIAYNELLGPSSIAFTARKMDLDGETAHSIHRPMTGKNARPVRKANSGKLGKNLLLWSGRWVP